jgi:hypothetical protein
VAAAPESDEPILLRRICSIVRVSSFSFSLLGLGLVYLLLSRAGLRPASASARGIHTSHFHFPAISQIILTLIRASPRVCQNLLGKYRDLATR